MVSNEKMSSQARSPQSPQQTAVNNATIEVPQSKARVEENTSPHRQSPKIAPTMKPPQNEPKTPWRCWADHLTIS